MSQLTQSTSVKDYFSNDVVRKKFAEILGKNSASFCTTVVQIASQNEMLSKCDPASIMQSAMMAATLNLPINPQLGLSYIVPYGTKATFQIGYKGLIQLCTNTGLYEYISSSQVYEGQLKSSNPLTGNVYDWDNKKSDKIIGYAAYFSLNNGFKKDSFMTVDELQAHGKKYSQTYKKGFGVWADDFDAMAKKTVLKLLLNTYAPKSIEMQRALIADQAVIEDADSMDVTYVDNQTTAQAVTSKQVEAKITDAEKSKRLIAAINKAKSTAELEKLRQYIDVNTETLFQEKAAEIAAQENIFN